MPAENLTNLDSGMTFTHLDATTILSRGLVAKGIHPTVDPLDLISTILLPFADWLGKGEKILQVLDFLVVAIGFLIN